MKRVLSSAALLLLLAAPAPGAPESDWRLVRSPHFEIYSQSGDSVTRALALWLEQLRTIVRQQTNLAPDGRTPIRVIAFRSTGVYDPYRVRTSSDAYYVGSESRDYIVMASASDYGIAAHEYAHAVLRAGGFDLPLWLREGLAEVLSSIRIAPRGASFGGELPARVATLKRESWIPFRTLLALDGERDLGDAAAIFYAQSWALTDLLELSPAYAARFPHFIAELNSGTSSERALAKIYGKSLDDLAAELRTRLLRRPPALRFPAPPSPEAVLETADVSEFRVRKLLAEVMLTSGETERAETLYRDLAREAPADPDVALGLGSLALRSGDTATARIQWKRAIEGGVQDAALCFRYAVLASDGGIAPDEIRPILQRAIAINPEFDDARFSLALLESNTGNAAAVIAQLRAMRHIAPSKAYGYWTTLADAFIQLGHRNEAVEAAEKAQDCAASDEQRTHAVDLAHVARTDLAVRMTRDAEGRAHMVTTRVEHDAPDWNPFIEPGDRIEHITGPLKEVDCTGKLLRLVIETPEGPLSLAIRSLNEVQIRNGSAEFTCGPQTGITLSIDYAKHPTETTAGDIRGIDFK